MPRKNLSKRRKQSRFNSRKNYQSKRRNLHTKKRKKYTKRRNTKRYKRNNLKFGGSSDDSEFVTNVEYIEPTGKLTRAWDIAARTLGKQKYKITASGNSIIMSFNNILEAFEIMAGSAAIVPGSEGIKFRAGDEVFTTQVSESQRYANENLIKLKRGYNSNEAGGEDWCGVIKVALNQLYRRLVADGDQSELDRFTGFINQHAV
jgi:hypothetical protein